jgi:hypothetical protein
VCPAAWTLAAPEPNKTNAATPPNIFRIDFIALFVLVGFEVSNRGFHARESRYPHAGAPHIRGDIRENIAILLLETRAAIAN